MKIQLDGAVCQGHGRCYELAPDIFTDDDRGHSELLRPEVPGELAAVAEEAVRACPERAISIIGS